MSDNSEPNRKQPLVTVGHHSETDVMTGETVSRRFVKMYFEARDSGLLAAMPDDIWKTLCCLATYIDENGHCHVGQERLARDLGVGRQAANQRIQRLREFRFEGRPVITITKTREHSAKGPTRWARNNYKLLPITGFQYGSRRYEEGEAENSRESSVSSQHDTELSQGSMSLLRDTEKRLDFQQSVQSSVSCSVSVSRDTNKSEQELNNVNVENFSEREGDRTLSDEQEALMLDILDVTGDRHSAGFYSNVVRALPEHNVRVRLSETNLAKRTRQIKKNAGAYFTDLILRDARELGIQLRRVES